mmetsp:Transcript_56293/g.163234  ORF Transcript_56293/g.163234 Transcript_56293/m.163234 type:complete len:212 (-) Transcript_56293:353-988(-)
MLRAGRCHILLAVALPVVAAAVEPQHVVSAPVADHRRHAHPQSARHLDQPLVVLANGGIQCTQAPWLCQQKFHGAQDACLGVDWEGQLHIDRFRGVDALAAGSVLLCGPIARSVASEASGDPAAVSGRMEGRMPRMLAGLLEVDLGAPLAAHRVRIAIIVRTLRWVRVLPHRHEVESSVAAAARARHIGGVLDLLPEETPSDVVFVVVDGI